jgi:hypothetical protein
MARACSIRVTIGPDRILLFAKAQAHAPFAGTFCFGAKIAAGPLAGDKARQVVALRKASMDGIAAE